MAKFARSARGQIVDFDLLEIQNTLKSVPPPVTADNRRQFINEKDGISEKKAAKIHEALAGNSNTQASDAMKLALAAAAESIAK
jgi:hypothetical protein